MAPKRRENDPARLHKYMDGKELIIRDLTVGPIFGSREMAYGGHSVKEATKKFEEQQAAARKEHLGE